MNLNEALGQFDIVEANLLRLENVWKEMEGLIHARGNVIGVKDERRYEELRRAFNAIANALPAIGGERFDGYPLDADEIAEWHYQTSQRRRI